MFLVNASPVRSSENSILAAVGIFIDISKQKNSDAELASVLLREQNAREQAEMALSLLEKERELREQFVATLSHDLRSPLTAAKMSAQILTRLGNDNLEKITKLVIRVVENIDRADQMIEDLLDANRIRAGQSLPLHLDECDLFEIAQNEVEDFTTIYGQRFVLQGQGAYPRNL